MESIVGRIRDTHSSGVSLPKAFSLKIQRTLASSVPPRPVVRVDFIESLLYVSQQFSFSDQLKAFCCINPGQDLIMAYRLFVSPERHLSVYARAVLQSLLNQNDKVLDVMPLNETILMDLRRNILPVSPIYDHNSNSDLQSSEQLQTFQALSEFLGKAVPSFLNFLRALCLNRCRVRRTLCHAVVEWDQLQANAEDIDGLISETTFEKSEQYPSGGHLTYSYPLSSWIYHYKLMQMEILIQMGFELRVYSLKELPSVLWYLSYTCSTHLGHLDRIGFFVNKRRSDEINDGASDQVLQQLLRIYNQLKGTEHFASSLHRLYVVLHRYGNPKDHPQLRYSSESSRHELRMRPFLGLAVPEPLSYEDVSWQSSLLQVPDLKLLEDATKLIALARKSWDEARRMGWTDPSYRIVREDNDLDGRSSEGLYEQLWDEETKRILKAGIATGIAIATVIKALAGSRKARLKVELPVQGDQDHWHKWWPVPRILIE